MDMQILVIDNDDSILFAFKRLLTKRGVKVAVANNFNKALDNLYLKKLVN